MAVGAVFGLVWFVILYVFETDDSIRTPLYQGMRQNGDRQKREGKTGK